MKINLRRKRNGLVGANLPKRMKAAEESLEYLWVKVQGILRQKAYIEKCASKGGGK